MTERFRLLILALVWLLGIVATLFTDVWLFGFTNNAGLFGALIVFVGFFGEFIILTELWR